MSAATSLATPGTSARWPSPRQSTSATASSEIERFLWDEIDRQRPGPAELPILIGVEQGAIMALAAAAAVPDLLSGVIAIDGCLPVVPGWTPPLAPLDGLPILLLGSAGACPRQQTRRCSWKADTGGDAAWHGARSVEQGHDHAADEVPGEVWRLDARQRMRTQFVIVYAAQCWSDQSAFNGSRRDRVQLRSRDVCLPSE